MSGAAAIVIASTILPAAADREYHASAASNEIVFSLVAPDPVAVGDSGKTEGTETVFVSVEVKSNPGVQSWVLLLDYDSSALAYDAFAADAFTGTTVFDKGGQLVINDFENADNSATGSAVTIAFKVKKGLNTGSYGSFTLSPDPDAQNFFNYAEQTLTPSISTATAPLTVQKVENIIPVESVQLNNTELTLDEGSEFTLTASVLPANATGQGVLFRSSNTAVATVDSNGKVKAVKSGTAVITAVSASGGKTASCSVTVNAVPVTGIALGQETVELTEGDSASLTWTFSPANASNKGVTFTSTNSSVARVGANGRITAVGAGNCTITITTDDGSFKDTVTVTVKAKKDPFTVAFTENPCTVKKGSTKQLAFKVTPQDPNSTMDKTFYENPANWHFESSRTDVATVNSSGVISALKKGTAVITATNPGYVDDGNRMIPVTVNVNVTDSKGVTANLSAYKSENPVTFKVTLTSGSTTVAQKTVSSGSSELFMGIADGTYMLKVECSDITYAPMSKEIVITNGEYAIDQIIYLYGDLNKDGKTNDEDLAKLQQYISHWTVYLPYEGVADVTANGKVDTEDISRYQQYLSHWNVVLGKRR